MIGVKDKAIKVSGLEKSFTLHVQGGTRLRAFAGMDFEVARGECLALVGESGSGKSSLLRSLYANYKPQRGSVLVRHRGQWVDMTEAAPHKVLEVRRYTMGYVSQFLRVIPRVSALEVVAEPLILLGLEPKKALARARDMLFGLRIPEKLWNLAPGTFSGGEQQRVNLARGFLPGLPIMLLDEPTASLDAANRRIVVDLIREAKRQGVAMVGIFHDEQVRDMLADRLLCMAAKASEGRGD
jgi:alpha-D-ribose 1-methylphosphonate 5-triphosphate synthase subunit PhnL